MRQLARRPAAGRRDVKLQLLLVLAVGEKGELFAVGRPGDGLFVVRVLAVARRDARARRDVDGRFARPREPFHIGHVRAVG
jgi:hypothetical protein